MYWVYNIVTLQTVVKRLNLSDMKFQNTSLNPQDESDLKELLSPKHKEGEKGRKQQQQNILCDETQLKIKKRTNKTLKGGSG